MFNEGTRPPIPALRIALAVCAALVVLGVFGPWVSYFGLTWNGVEGGGLLALLFAAMAATGAIVGLLQSPRPRWAGWLSLSGFVLAAVWGVLIFFILVDAARTEVGSSGFTGFRAEWGLWVYAVGALVGVILSIIDLSRGSEPTGHGSAAYGALPSPVVIQNYNQSTAQIGDNDNRRLTYQANPGYGGARIGVVDRGVPRPDLSARPGQSLMVGRDASSTVVLSDPKASRRHVEIVFEGSSWVVRDLGAMNPTRILSSDGSEQVIGSSTRRLEFGQLAIGDSVITLYPAGR